MNYECQQEPKKSTKPSKELDPRSSVEIKKAIKDVQDAVNGSLKKLKVEIKKRDDANKEVAKLRAEHGELIKRLKKESSALHSKTMEEARSITV